MHSHDRTLIARLGFGDPDKGNRLHDLACQYLALPESLARLVEIEENENRKAIGLAVRFEHPITKGEGQYATTIGFLDVLGWSNVQVRCTDGFLMQMEGAKFAIEVKIGPVSTGDIIRQINFYREYVCARGGWFVATLFVPTDADLAMLRSADIRHIQLGAKFEAWAEEQQAATPQPREDF